MDRLQRCFFPAQLPANRSEALARPLEAEGETRVRGDIGHSEDLDV
jgi:hypothetical protein